MYVCMYVSKTSQPFHERFDLTDLVNQIFLNYFFRLREWLPILSVFYVMITFKLQFKFTSCFKHSHQTSRTINSETTKSTTKRSGAVYQWSRRQRNNPVFIRNTRGCSVEETPGGNVGPNIRKTGTENNMEIKR